MKDRKIMSVLEPQLYVMAKDFINLVHNSKDKLRNSPSDVRQLRSMMTAVVANSLPKPKKFKKRSFRKGFGLWYLERYSKSQYHQAYLKCLEYNEKRLSMFLINRLGTLWEVKDNNLRISMTHVFKEKINKTEER